MKFAKNINMKKKIVKPADQIQDLQYFGEYGGVNPSIADSSTFTYLAGKTMGDVFEGNREGCYLYSRHTNPSTSYLGEALAKMEYLNASILTSSGMAAISTAILEICSSGDHIVSSRTVYGGTYALMKNYLTKFNINTSFVDITDYTTIEKAITKNTKILYCETISNPLLEVADLNKLSEIAKKNNLKLVVDNTFTPLIFTPAQIGADIVIHSLTKFINGSSDTVGGVICSNEEFISNLIDVNSGSAMLLGPVMDSFRAASILKNLRTLHIRMKQHSKNALFLSKKLTKAGYKIIYPGLKNHPQHNIMTNLINTEFGYGGIFVLDTKNEVNANKLMESMQNENLGYLAVSLGFYKTLFSAPGLSTSSEIPVEERSTIGLSDGLVRVSIGIDNNIERTYDKIISCLKKNNI